MKKVTSVLMFAMLLCTGVFAQTTQTVFEEPKNKINAHSADVTVMMLTPDRKNLVTAARDMEIKFYNLEDGQVTKTISGSGSVVLSLSFSKDGKYMLGGCGDGSAILWNMENGQIIQRLRNHTAQVNAVAISPDANAKFLYTASEDGNMQVYDRSLNNKFIKTIAVEGGHAMCMTFDAAGKNILLGCSDGKVRVLDPAAGKFVNTYEGHAKEITAITLSPDGKYFATSSNDNKINYYDASTGAIVKTFEGHEWKVLDVDISSDGKYLASASNDGSLRLWDITSGKNIKMINLKNKRTFYTVVFTPDMKSVISGMQVKNQVTPAIMWWNTGL